MQPEREYYALDRIEAGTAVLLALEPECAEPEVRLPAAALADDCGRPADGTLFYRDGTGAWQADLAATQARQQAMRARVQKLLHKRH